MNITYFIIADLVELDGWRETQVGSQEGKLCETGRKSERESVRNSLNLFEPASRSSSKARGLSRRLFLPPSP